MAVYIDSAARIAIARRRASGRDSAIEIRLVYRRCMPPMAQVGWVGRTMHRASLIACLVDDIPVCLHRRIAHYIQAHDITVTTRRLGPFAGLALVDEAALPLEIEDWENAGCPTHGSFRAAHPVRGKD